jgi:hypothetical protein
MPGLIQPINLEAFQKFSIQQLYYLLFQYMARDFMARRDCFLVHVPPNMATVSGSPIVYANPAFIGGHATSIPDLAATYGARAVSGEVQLEAAEETGVFLGI